jgi:solute carrier family 35 protein E1
MELQMLCSIWYLTSMLANTSAGQILNTFPRPVTLTVIQFFCVSSWCLFLSWLSSVYPSLKDHIPALRNGIRKPTRELIITTLPLTGFMIGGHILTSDAMSRIPVSLVHTIKGLTPLITVAAYRFIFHIHYSPATYLSLIPLTVGVIMACSTNFSANFLGLCSAFASAILFVTQNIISKKLFNEAAAAELDGPSKSKKPDKLNLLCYSSALALLFCLPLWLWSEGFTIIADLLHDAAIDLSGKSGSLDHGRLALEYLFNGTFHFAQSLVAFTLLAMVSPVTYSVASLIKRVFVICFAIIWFGNRVTGLQGVGIALTFLGLYLYDRTSDANKADRKARLMQLNQPTLLPLHEKPFESPNYTETPVSYTIGPVAEEKRFDAAGPGRPDPTGNGWLHPGMKAEETWTPQDLRKGQAVPVS